MARSERTERGFTLIELMVILLIIAIVMGIAVPLLLGATSSAKNRVARSVVVATVTASEHVYREYGGFPTSWTSADWREALAAAIPSTISLTTSAATASQQVSYDATTDYFAAAARAGSGSSSQCFVAVYDPVPGSYGWGTQGGEFITHEATPASGCSASSAIDLSGYQPIVSSPKINGYYGSSS